MEEINCTYAFKFSLLAALVREALLLLAHPLMLSLPAILLAASVPAPRGGATAAAAVLLFFLQKLVRSFCQAALTRLEAPSALPF